MCIPAYRSQICCCLLFNIQFRFIVIVNARLTHPGSILVIVESNYFLIFCCSYVVCIEFGFIGIAV